MAEKKTLSGREVAADIRAGATDEFLMTKYGLTEQGLESLFRKLVGAGIISQAEIDRRRAEEPEVEIIDDMSQSDIPNWNPVTKDSLSKLGEGASRQPEKTEEEVPDRPATTEDISLQNLFGDWYESKRKLILVLIFATPVGLYGLYKTSRFPKKTKIGVAILTVVLALATISPAVKLWLAGVVGIGVYALYKLLPFRKPARVAISIVAAMMVLGMIGAIIDGDSGKRRRVSAQATETAQPAPQPVQATPVPVAAEAKTTPQPSSPKPVPVAQPTATASQETQKSADSEAEKKKKFDACLDSCLKDCPSVNAWKYALKKQGITGDLADSMAKAEREKCEKKCLEQCGGKVYSKEEMNAGECVAACSKQKCPTYPVLLQQYRSKGYSDVDAVDAAMKEVKACLVRCKAECGMK